MRPLILQYSETPTGNQLDFSLVEYSVEQNLTVIKNTDIPAVKFMSLDTNTFTRTGGEQSDSDAQKISLIQELQNLLDTRTKTFSGEESDSDNQIKAEIQNIKTLLDTKTVTLVSTEAVDSDNDRAKALLSLLDTKTITENVENSDSDR